MLVYYISLLIMRYLTVYRKSFYNTYLIISPENSKFHHFYSLGITIYFYIEKIKVEQ